MPKAKPKKVTVCVIVEYGEEVGRPHYVTGERNWALKECDLWAAKRMKERHGEVTRVTFLDVVHSISF